MRSALSTDDSGGDARGQKERRTRIAWGLRCASTPATQPANFCLRRVLLTAPVNRALATAAFTPSGNLLLCCRLFDCEIEFGGEFHAVDIEGHRAGDVEFVGVGDRSAEFAIEQDLAGG